MYSDIDDIIVAVASPPGPGARAVIRISGPGSIALAERRFAGDEDGSLDQRPGYSRIAGRIRLSEPGLTLPAELYLFRAPHSYTRQDCVEMHTISSPPLLSEIIELLIHDGARLAEPGEFTARAFLNGGMDLSSAEAVAQLIAARSDEQLRAAREQIHGSLHQRTRSLTDALSDALALIEAEIDFAEEPITFITVDELRARLNEVAAGLERLLADAAGSERIEHLPRVLLAGPPNAGKSTLMNALSGMNRAICSPLSGTTRDILAAPVSAGGGEALLLDSAGIDDLAAGEADETDGPAQPARPDFQRAARRLLDPLAQGVEVLAVVVAADDPNPRGRFHQHARGRKDALLVINKIDLLSAPQRERLDQAVREWRAGPVAAVSAITGEGVDGLARRIAELTGLQTARSETRVFFLNARHRTAVADTIGFIKAAMDLVSREASLEGCADLLAFELHEAIDALGAIVGEVTHEDLLTRIFGRFCIGK